MYKQGDKVRRIESRNAIDDQFDGSGSQHGKQGATVMRVYEDLGADVCDLEYADGTIDEKVSVDELEPLRNNIDA